MLSVGRGRWGGGISFVPTDYLVPLADDAFPEHLAGGLDAEQY
jgi:hypothetical protein